MPTERSVFQFKVTLEEIRPKIWRRILVPDNYTFWALHVAIQDALGWKDYHLHQFQVDNPDDGQTDLIGIPDEDEWEELPAVYPGWSIYLADYFMEAGQRSGYLYDYGDSWQHEVIFEGRFPRIKGGRYPQCHEGARACPPEDCGGVRGYTEMLKILKKPNHEEYESLREWVGRGYNPDYFDEEKVRFENPERRFDIAFGGRDL